jgi:Arc/MetJ-type ribon-helix-helix transcriptional regulator
VVTRPLSVSLPAEDVEFLDAYAAAKGFASRSAVLHRAVRLLRATELGPAYEYAFVEWNRTGAADEWATTAADDL